jgi:uncharacterized membrane protein YbhN (UPF0104 family)
MQYVGRNILSAELNTKHSVIALSSLLEILFYIITCAILCLALGGNKIILLLKEYIDLDKMFLIAITLLVILVSLVLLFFHSRTRNLFSKIKLMHLRKMLNPFVKYFLLYSVYFIFLGLFFFITMRLYNKEITGIFVVISAFIIASFIGTVTPGAPGGIGIREAVLLFLLGPSCGESAVLQGAVIQRFAIVIADLLVFPVFTFVTGRFFRIRETTL